MLVNWNTVLRKLATSDLKNAFHVLIFTVKATWYFKQVQVQGPFNSDCNRCGQQRIGYSSCGCSY